MTRVLIADDKETSRELIRAVLESLGDTGSFWRAIGA